MNILKNVVRWIGKYIIVWCLIAVLTIVSFGLYKHLKRGS